MICIIMIRDTMIRGTMIRSTTIRCNMGSVPGNS
jgi:hypothetical protein